MATRYDVVINGGGMVGLSVALGLPEDLTVAVIDPLPLVSIATLAESSEYFTRVSAISRHSKSLLKQVGAWQRIPEKRITPYHAMVVWEENGSSELAFSAEQIAEADLGHIVENELLRSAFFEQAALQSNIHFLNSKLASCEIEDETVFCRLEDDHRLECSLLIGADGARSQVREVCNFTQQSMSYQQYALVANIQIEKSHQNIAWQRFLGTGPMAYLPLPDQHQCSIVWTIAQDQADLMLKLDKADLECRIAAALDHRLGHVQLKSDVSTFPLIAQHSEHYVQHRVALVGDAAHTIHPLAGQGVNLGFADAEELTKQIALVNKMQGDIGIKRNLRPFERARKADNHLTQKTMTALNWVYQQKTPAMVIARNWGVNLINGMPIVKDQLIRKAMGY